MISGNKIKLAVVFSACFLFRLFPFRVPNVEPILASQMPLSKQNGAFAGSLFGFLSIVLFDMHLRPNSLAMLDGHRDELARMGVVQIEDVLVPNYYDEGEDAVYRVYEISPQ